MRVCLIREYFYPDVTGPTVMSELARYLKDHHPDLELDVITSRNVYRGVEHLPAYSEWDGIRITRLATPKSKRPSTLLRLGAGLLFTAAVGRALARAPRYDVILLLSDPPSLPLSVARYARATGTPYVYLVPDLFPDLGVRLGVLHAGSPLVALARARQRRWLHDAAQVVVIGRDMRDYLMAHYGLPAERVSVIPNHADPTRITPGSRETAFRRVHGLRGFLVLYAGNLGRHQRFEDILDAAVLLQTERPEVQFVFVGVGARRPELADAVAERRLSNVRLYSPVEASGLGDLLNSADVALVTLEPGAEGMGVPSKFYNGLAAGRPTIALMSRDAEVARVVMEHDCGLQVDHDNPRALADAVLRLANDPAAVARMGRHARETLLQHYTLEQMAEAYYRVLCAAARMEPAEV